MLRYIIRPLFCLVLCCAVSPQVVANALPKTRIWQATWYLGLDLAKTCVGWYQKTGHAYEVHGAIDLSSVSLNVDYGWGKIHRDSRRQNGSLASADGRYFRVGLDYNFLTPTAHHNQFFIGVRYARSFFDFQLESTKLQCNHRPDKDCIPELCIAPVAMRNHAGSAIVHWWEIVAGGKVYLTRILSIGCTARYKFKRRIENKLYVLPFDIPGFGLTEFDHAFGYSWYLLLRIPLGKSNRPLP